MDASSRSGHLRENSRIQVNATNITVLSSPHDSEPVLDIIFVHGLQGHPFRTWAAKPRAPASIEKTSRSRRLFRISASSSAPSDGHRHNAQDGFYWPLDALPEHCPQARILTWGYDSTVARTGNSVNQNSLYDHAQDLVFALKRKLAPERPIVFVTHSLGGVIVKDALSFSHASNDSGTKSVVQNTAAIVFLGTPHRGSQSAEMAETARKIVSVVGLDSNDKILASLGLQNSDLIRVQASFSNVWNAYQFRVKTFQEGLGFKPTSWFRMNRKIVDIISSTLGDTREEAETLQANHTEMCRFPDANDQNAVKVLDELGVIYNWVLEFWIPQHVPRNVPENLTHVNHPAQEPVSNDQIPSIKDKIYLLTESRESLYFPGIIANDPVINYESSSLPTLEKMWLDHLSSDDEKDSKKRRRLLWIKGSLGSGKSILMREAFHRHTQRGHCTAAFFCDASAKENLLHSASGLFRSLLYQLLPLCFRGDLRCEDLANLLETKFDRVKSADAKLEWELKELEQLLKTLVRQNLDRDIVLFIDALDQYSEEDRLLIIECLAELSRKEGDQVDSEIQIWVSSRDQVVLVPEDCLAIQIESINWDAINEYVDEKLKLHPKSKLDEFGYFKMQLKTRSSGNFLWVVLVIDIIRQRMLRAKFDIKSLETQLGRLPERLHDLYYTMLKEAEEDRPIRLRFFQWAVLNEDLTLEHWQSILPFLETPVPQSLEECEDLRLQEDGEDPRSREDIYSKVEDRVSYLSLGLFRAALCLNDDAVSTNFDSERSIEGAAGSMDSRAGNTRMVRPVHESVKTFFTQHNGFRALVDEEQPCSLENGYNTVIHTCLDFISLKDFDDLVDSRQRAYFVDQARLPIFPAYASDRSDSNRTYPRHSRSRSVASFSSAGSRYGSATSWATTSSADDVVSLEAGDQSQSLILRNDLIESTNDERKMTSQADMTNFRLGYLWSDKPHNALDTDSIRPDHISIGSETPEQPTRAQQLGTKFLTYVNRNLLGYCRSLDARGYTPESVIHRLQHEDLWNRWFCLNEINPSTVELPTYLEIEQLYTWVNYLSTTKDSTYEITAKSPEDLGDWRNESVSLRYCLDLGDRFIPYVTGGAEVDSYPDKENLHIKDLLKQIRRQLLWAMVKNPLTRMRFIPTQKLRHILTPLVIRQVLESSKDIVSTPENIATIYGSFLRIFATLIRVRKPANIRIFLDKNINDHFLPLAFEDEDDVFTSLSNGNRITLTSLDLDEEDAEAFSYSQYLFQTPFLTRQGNDLYHYKLLSAAVELPIINATLWMDSKRSQIHKVQFSPHTTNFSTSRNESQELFLLERINKMPRSSRGHTWRHFLSKVYTWQYLKRDGRSNSILEILCTIEHSDEQSSPFYDIIYPCPKGTLGTLFECDPQGTGVNIAWLKTQFCNMAKALAAVYDVSKIRTGKLPRFKYLRRPHLQYNNVLWFHHDGQPPGYLILSHLEGDTNISSIGPEYEERREESGRIKKGHLGKATQIWSLGAILLDIIVWYLKGGYEVRELQNVCRKESNGFYYQRVKYTEDRLFVVSPAVLSLIAALKSVQDCHPYIRSVLDVIQYGMLVVDPRERISVQELVDILDLTNSITDE